MTSREINKLWEETSARCSAELTMVTRRQMKTFCLPASFFVKCSCFASMFYVCWWIQLNNLTFLPIHLQSFKCYVLWGQKQKIKVLSASCVTDWVPRASELNQNCITDFVIPANIVSLSHQSIWYRTMNTWSTQTWSLLVQETFVLSYFTVILFISSSGNDRNHKALPPWPPAVPPAWLETPAQHLSLFHR